MVLTDRPDYATKIRKFGGLGYKTLCAEAGLRQLLPSEFQNPNYKRHDTVGLNYRMPEIIAALGLSQLKRFSSQVKRKEENYFYIKEWLREIEGINLLKEDKRITRRGFYVLTLLYKGGKKKKIIEALNKKGIPAGEGYGIPLYKNPAFKRENLSKIYSEDIMKRVPDYSSLHLPNSERFCEEQITFPHWILLKSRRFICDMLSTIKESV